MGHGLWFDEQGRASMMYFGEEPWHGLGQKVERAATAAEAIEAANLDWEVVKLPLYATGNGHSQRVTDKQAVVPADRWSTPACPILGLVGPEYKLLQNRDAFAFFDPIVGEGAAAYHTAGSIDDGARIWIMAKLPTSITIADGDITDKYLLLSNSHDGKSSVQVKFTPIRVVCQNTLTMALSDGPTLRVAHSSNMKANLEVARGNLKLIHKHYDNIEASFRVLASVEMDEKRLADYIQAVFPLPKKSKTQSVINRVMQDRHEVARLFENGQGNHLPGVTGTLWAAYNGIAEYVDHRDTRRGGMQKLKYIWYGDGADLKAKAYHVAVDKIRNWDASAWAHLHEMSNAPV